MKEQSIRKQLLYWLLIPLCSLFVITTAFAYFLAHQVANKTHDDTLVTSAGAVAARLRWKDDKIIVDLPAAAQAILRYSDTDKIYFQVLDGNRKRISGDIVLPGPVLHPDAEGPVFRYGELNGQSLRIARIKVHNRDDANQTALVQVAETLNGRQLLARQIMLSIIAPQILLIGLGAFTVWIGVSKGLIPLSRLQQALGRRSPQDLTELSMEGVPVEVKPLVVAINELLTRLRKELESQRRFVANAAHQLRTPLAGLATYSGLAKRLAKDKELKRVIDQMETGTDRVVHLVNRLLALARAEGSMQRRDTFAQVDLNFVASDATSELVQEALKRNVDLSLEASEKPALIQGDFASLKELAVNLVENAILYTSEGGKVSVRVTNGDGVLLTVQDDGPGIPAEDKERVFERFYRILGTNVPGSGLGLAIVKDVAEAHNATISLQDPPSGCGTVISVAFKTL